MSSRTRIGRALGAITMVVATLTLAMPAQPAFASGPTLHSAGSTWVQIALQQWTSDVSRFGLSVDYQGIGSTAGRQNYMYNLIDFAATEIPYQPDELAQYHTELKSRFRSYQYIPDVAGGTSFMYNIVDPTTGRRITNLRLSSGTIAKIFTGHITSWRDPAIVADNPGLNLPNAPLTPVVRSDSSGTSGQLSLYLAATQPGLWNPFAAAHGCPPPCASWPTDPPFIGQSLSSGVTNFVASTPNTINYVEAGYALAKGFPVAYVHNASNNWALPLSQNVSTALTHATLNADLTQNLGGVYNAPEPNAYPLSSYSYLITPTSVIDPAKGLVLGKFLLYVACAGQQEAGLLGYSPLPPQLVNFVFQAINRINGHPPTPDLNTAAGRAQCPNPTFGGGGGGGGGGNNGGGGGNNGGNGTGTNGNGNSTGTHGGGTKAAATSTTTAKALKAAAGTNLGKGGSGVFGDQTAAAVSPAEQTATLLAARRQAAYGSLSHVHSETQTALEWAALYVPLLVYGPILLRRRRRSTRADAASNKETAGAA
jgi:phosphate transport system substrate-binding protein